MKPEQPTNPTNYKRSYKGKTPTITSTCPVSLLKHELKVYLFLSSLTCIETYLKNSPTHSISVSTLYASFTDHDNMNTGEKQKYKDLLRTPGPQSIFPYSKPLETRTQKRHAHVTPTNLITRHPDQPMLQLSQMKPESEHNQTFKQISLQELSDQHTSSQQNYSFSSSVVQTLELTQTSGFTLNNMNSITSTTPVEVHQYWSQSAEQFTATKASQTNNTELVEMVNKNTSKAPMRTTDNNSR